VKEEPFMKAPANYNVIVIMLDSFRQDHISFYNRGRPVSEGIESCKTPNIDKFAEESIVFENGYPSGLPTIPVRTELMTGQDS
jgi:arylsulfatase A-like enzyme